MENQEEEKIKLKCKHKRFIVSEINDFILYLKCQEFNCNYSGETNLLDMPKTRFKWYDLEELVICPRCEIEIINCRHGKEIRWLNIGFNFKISNIGLKYLYKGLKDGSLHNNIPVTDYDIFIAGMASLSNLENENMLVNIKKKLKNFEDK